MSTETTTRRPMFDLPEQFRTEATEHAIGLVEEQLAAIRADVEVSAADPEYIEAAAKTAADLVDSLRDVTLPFLLSEDFPAADLRAALPQGKHSPVRANAKPLDVAKAVVRQAQTSTMGADAAQGWRDLAHIDYAANVVRQDRRIAEETPVVLGAWATRDGRFLTGFAGGRLDGDPAGYQTALWRVGRTYLAALGEGADDREAFRHALVTANEGLTGREVSTHEVGHTRVADVHTWMMARAGYAFAVRVLAPAVLGYRQSEEIGVKPEVFLIRD